MRRLTCVEGGIQRQSGGIGEVGSGGGSFAEVSLAEPRLMGTGSGRTSGRMNFARILSACWRQALFDDDDDDDDYGDFGEQDGDGDEDGNRDQEEAGFESRVARLAGLESVSG